MDIVDPTSNSLIRFDESSQTYVAFDLRNLMFEKTGWELDDSMEYSYVDATRTMTITATKDTWYYVQNIRYEVASGSSYSVVIDDVEGNWFFTLNTSMTLVASQTVWAFLGADYAKCTYAYWDATNKEFIAAGWEFHTHEMPPVVHRNNHYGIGTYKVGSGLVASTSLNEINVTAGSIGDEDLVKAISDVDTPTNIFEQKLSPLFADIIYRDGVNGLLRKSAATVDPFIIVGTKIQLNPGILGNYSLTNMTNNRYGAYWVVVTTDQDSPVKLMPGQAEAASLNDVIDANGILSMDFGSVPLAEVIVNSRIIVKQIVGAPYYEIIQVDDFYIDPQIGVPSGGGTSHGGLSGLNDDDHTQYLLTGGTRIWTGNMNAGGYNIANLGIEQLAVEPSTTYPRIYYNTILLVFRVYTNGSWGDLENANVGAIFRDYEAIATAGQTIFDISLSGFTYSVGNNTMEVYKKNVSGYYELLDQDDYVETDTSTVTLNSGASLSDEFRFKWMTNLQTVLDAIADGSITDAKLSNAGGQIKEQVTNAIESIAFNDLYGGI